MQETGQGRAGQRRRQGIDIPWRCDHLKKSARKRGLLEIRTCGFRSFRKNPAFNQISNRAGRTGQGRAAQQEPGRAGQEGRAKARQGKGKGKGRAETIGNLMRT